MLDHLNNDSNCKQKHDVKNQLILEGYRLYLLVQLISTFEIIRSIVLKLIFDSSQAYLCERNTERNIFSRYRLFYFILLFSLTVDVRLALLNMAVFRAVSAMIFVLFLSIFILQVRVKVIERTWVLYYNNNVCCTTNVLLLTNTCEQWIRSYATISLGGSMEATSHPCHQKLLLLLY